MNAISKCVPTLSVSLLIVIKLHELARYPLMEKASVYVMCFNYTIIILIIIIISVGQILLSYISDTSHTL